MKEMRKPCQTRPDQTRPDQTRPDSSTAFIINNDCIELIEQT
ncbi:hypothetical protein [Pseudobutyrivibrio xylanivorans]|nr:hypothetical protein [Pseudobutyrivibrio xylanivorans]